MAPPSPPSTAATDTAVKPPVRMAACPMLSTELMTSVEEYALWVRVLQPITRQGTRTLPHTGCTDWLHWLAALITCTTHKTSPLIADEVFIIASHFQLLVVEQLYSLIVDERVHSPP